MPLAAECLKGASTTSGTGISMSVVFVHLSDIHFGQEKDGSLWIHDDVKERLIDDVGSMTKSFNGERVTGIIVTGDIAYSGCPEEYVAAATWLDRVAEVAGCAITDIQVVPGNHDIDRKEITALTEMMLDKIVAEGEPALDRFLKTDTDREMLFRRFSGYLPFAEGYRCPLDTNAVLAEDRLVALAPGRAIRFIRLNSALACSHKDVEGKLLLGARQRVLKQRAGEELIVLSHHPVHWFQDSADALLFIRNRARVFISGHEHNPSVKTENIEEGSDLMMLAAGATVPPTSNAEFTYCYNFIEFDWDPEADALSVHVYPRAWINEKKRFESDDTRLGGKEPKCILACPNFRGATQAVVVPDHTIESGASDTIIIVPPEDQESEGREDSVNDNYPMLLLRFFRDISPAQRVGILSSLGALPPNWKGRLSEPFERGAFDNLVKEGKSEELWKHLREILEN
jgi:predicted phosphodiesterase